MVSMITIPTTARGIGAPLPRVEDARLVTGRGRYVDDVRLMDMAHAHLLRSPHAHARIRSLDVAAARAAPGVLAILTGADLVRDGIGDLPCHAVPPPPTGATLFRPPYPLLAGDRVRYVGDRVALVVAASAALAKDAAELIAVAYEPLPAVVRIETALDPVGPKVWDQAESNMCFRIERGDAAAVARAFAAAAHVVTLTSRYPRISANAMEPRASVGWRDPLAGRYTLYTGTQQIHRMKDTIAATVLHIPDADLRVVVTDLGGGFGLKGSPYAEDALVLWASSKVGRPVKWTAERSEALMSDNHARDRLDEGEIAFDRDGRILAMRTVITVNAGANLVLSAGVPSINAERLCAAYHVPQCHVLVRTVCTNTSPVAVYRGTGRPESNLFLERLMDKAAREIGIDRIELRRRNLIPAAALPYRTPGGYTIDSGDFACVLDRSLALADWPGFAERRRASAARGRLRGIGIGLYVILSGSTLQSERMEIRIEMDGAVTVLAGTQSSGQGHETMYAQMMADWVGVAAEHVRVFQGDTDRVLFGRGTLAGRSAMMGGAALRLAADDLIRNGKRFAAWMFEASETDIEFAAGRFSVAGTDRAATLAEVARRCYNSANMPPELPVGLGGVGGYSGPPSFPNGAMVCEVEIDPETGAATLERCWSVSDSGTIINPLTLAGQMHGAIGQAAGEMLIEEVRHDPASGQLLTGSFLDYAMPRADLLPALETEFVVVPATTNPLGVKGGSEGGSSGAPSAIYNAILDALAPLGVVDLPLPATPERIWRAMSGLSRA